MSKREIKEASRGEYSTVGDNPNFEEIQTGALLRIADATEAMAREYNRLLSDRKDYEERAREERLMKEHLFRSNAALRAWITRLKRKA